MCGFLAVLFGNAGAKAHMELIIEDAKKMDKLSIDLKMLKQLRSALRQGYALDIKMLYKAFIAVSAHPPCFAPTSASFV